MVFNPDSHHRKSIRIANFDYAKPGAYFITICAFQRAHLFGHITHGEMNLNKAGQIIRQVWDELQAFYPNIGTDEFIIMPDHIHGIIMVGAAPCGRPNIGAQFFTSGRPQGAAPTLLSLSLPEIVHRFKSLSTRRVSDAVTNGQVPYFSGRFWQRNYWERIIRNERELQSVRQYIRNNPAQWRNSE